jgi:hypothetical protein
MLLKLLPGLFGNETKGLRRSFGLMPPYFLCYDNVKIGTEAFKDGGIDA